MSAGFQEFRRLELQLATANQKEEAAERKLDRARVEADLALQQLLDFESQWEEEVRRKWADKGRDLAAAEKGLRHLKDWQGQTPSPEVLNIYKHDSLYLRYWDQVQEFKDFVQYMMHFRVDYPKWPSEYLFDRERFWEEEIETVNLAAWIRDQVETPRL